MRNLRRKCNGLRKYRREVVFVLKEAQSLMSYIGVGVFEKDGYLIDYFIY